MWNAQELRYPWTTGSVRCGVWKPRLNGLSYLAPDATTEDQLGDQAVPQWMNCRIDQIRNTSHPIVASAPTAKMLMANRFRLVPNVFSRRSLPRLFEMSSNITY